MDEHIHPRMNIYLVCATKNNILRTRVCMLYVCMSINRCVCTGANVCASLIPVGVHTRMCVCTLILVCVRTRMCVCVRVSVCVHVRATKYTRACVCV